MRGKGNDNAETEYYSRTLMAQTSLEPMKLVRDILFVLKIYGPVNPMGSCRAWSVYLTTRLLGRFSPLSS